MALQFRTAPQITREVLDSLAGAASPLTDANLGSVLRTFIEGHALVLAELHFMIRKVLDSAFAATATGDSLDQIAQEIGLSRSRATPTTRNLTFTKLGGSPGATISAGDQWRTPRGVSPRVTFQILSTTVLAAGALTQAIPAVSTDLGAFTNINDGIELEEVGPATGGIDSVVTATTSFAGTDDEPDGPIGLFPPRGSLRYRVLRKKRNPEGPGSVADLETWSLAVDGVGDAKAIANTPDIGYADLYILATGDALPDSDLLAAVQAAIDAKVSVGATVTAKAPTQLTVNAQVTVTPAPGFDGTTVRSAVENAISEYLDGLGIGEDALYAALANAVWTTAGVGGSTGTDGGNYSSLLFVVAFTPTAHDVTVTAGQKVVAGSVTVS